MKNCLRECGLRAEWKSPCGASVHWAALSVSPYELWQSLFGQNPLLHTHHLFHLFLPLTEVHPHPESCASEGAIIKYAANPTLFREPLRPLDSFCVWGRVTSPLSSGQLALLLHPSLFVTPCVSVSPDYSFNFWQTECILLQWASLSRPLTCFPFTHAIFKAQGRLVLHAMFSVVSALR